LSTDVMRAPPPKLKRLSSDMITGKTF